MDCPSVWKGRGDPVNRITLKTFIPRAFGSLLGSDNPAGEATRLCPFVHFPFSMEKCARPADAGGPVPCGVSR